MENWGSEREGHPPNLYQVPRLTAGTEDKREGPDPVLQSPPSLLGTPVAAHLRDQKAPPGHKRPTRWKEGASRPAQAPSPSLCLLHFFLLTAWFSTFTAVISVKRSAVCYFIIPPQALTKLLISIPVDFYTDRHPTPTMSKI